MRYAAITGYAKEYRVSEEGVIQRKTSEGSWVNVSTRVERSSLRVKLLRKDGTRHHKLVRSIVRDAFLGGPRAGYRLVPKNGMCSDCSVYNLKWVPKHLVHKVHDWTTRKPVIKLDKQGNVLDCYSSVKEAAVKNYVSVASVSRRCNNRVKDPFNFIDFTFAFER